MVRCTGKRGRLLRHDSKPAGARVAALLARASLLTMPHGTRHEFTGMLLEQCGGLVLDVDGGGAWRLDAGWRARKLLGMQVRVVGVRDGFDLLTVQKLERV